MGRRLSTIFMAGVWLSAPFYASSTQAAFELIKEWVLTEPLEGGYFNLPGPNWPVSDGSIYFWDTSGFSPYPIWHLQGTTISPVTGFTPATGTFQLVMTFSVGNMVVLSGLLNGEPKHWKIEGNAAMPLESEFGPVPFASEWMWTPIETGTIISGRDEAHGRELWLMDESGYSLIADLKEGPESSHPGEAGWDAVQIHDWYETFVGSNGPESRLVFTLDNGLTGPEPWVYDVEENSLTLIADLIEGPDGSHPWWIGRLGIYHYFGTVDRQIYKSDEITAQSIVESYGSGFYGYTYAQSVLEFDGDLYPWWRPHGFDPTGYVLRISPDDSIRHFKPRLHALDNGTELVSLVPYDGVIQMIGDSRILKIDGDDVRHSDAFDGIAGQPEFIAWNDDEWLFQEGENNINEDDIFCLIDGQAKPMWRKPSNIPYAGMSMYGRGDWVYLKVVDHRAIHGDPGGTVQLWGMHWPSGCQQPLVETMVIDSGLNDAWFNPESPGQGFFITVFEDIQMMFVAWFTYDTERPDKGVHAALGEPGHRWLTAFGPYEGSRADLRIELTRGGVFDAAVPAPTQQGKGRLRIEFTGCNSALVTYDMRSLVLNGVIPIERIAQDNVGRCEDALVRVTGSE